MVVSKVMMHFVGKCAICTLTFLALVKYTFGFWAVTLGLSDPATKQWHRSLHWILSFKSISYFYAISGCIRSPVPSNGLRRCQKLVGLSNFRVRLSKMGSIVIPRLVTSPMGVYGKGEGGHMGCH